MPWGWAKRRFNQAMGSVSGPGQGTRFAFGEQGPSAEEISACNARNDLCSKVGVKYAEARSAFNNAAGDYNSAVSQAQGINNNVVRAGCPNLRPQGIANVSWS